MTNQHQITVAVTATNNSFYVNVRNVEILNMHRDDLVKLQRRCAVFLRGKLRILQQTHSECDRRREGQCLAVVFRVPPPVTPRAAGQIKQALVHYAAEFWHEVEEQCMKRSAQAA